MCPFQNYPFSPFSFSELTCFSLFLSIFFLQIFLFRTINVHNFLFRRVLFQSVPFQTCPFSRYSPSGFGADDDRRGGGEPVQAAARVIDLELRGERAAAMCLVRSPPSRRNAIPYRSSQLPAIHLPVGPSAVILAVIESKTYPAPRHAWQCLTCKWPAPSSHLSRHLSGTAGVLTPGCCSRRPGRPWRQQWRRNCHGPGPEGPKKETCKTKKESKKQNMGVPRNQ